MIGASPPEKDSNQYQNSLNKLATIEIVIQWRKSFGGETRSSEDLVDHLWDTAREDSQVQNSLPPVASHLIQ